MAYTYKLIADDPKTGAKANSILRKEDEAFIAMDEMNKDYQEYLEWVANGNTPEAAD